MIWITFLGESPYASINTLWLCKRLKDINLKKLIIIKNEKVNHNSIKCLKEEALIIYPNIIIEEKEIVEDNIYDISCLLESLFKNNPKKCIVDITPGRKYMSALALKYGLKFNIEYIFYTHLKENSYFGKRYDCIPIIYHQLIDLKNG
jgi:hypothetical protein